MASSIAMIPPDEASEKRKRSLMCSVPSTLSPSLVFSYGQTNCKQSFFTISDGCYYRRSVPELRRMYCRASSPQGWLLMLQLHHSSTTTSCYLYNPHFIRKIHLPPLPLIESSLTSQYFYGLITDDPNHSNCFVMLIGSNTGTCLYCRPHDHNHESDLVTGKWMQLELEPKYKIQGFDGTITGAICCNDKIYITCLGEEVVIQMELNHHDLSMQPTITMYGIAPLNDRIFMPNGISSRTNLVESRGDIFKVKREYLGLTDQLQTVELYKLDLSLKVWVKVQALSDRIFLLGGSSISISATQFGLSGNCIYFFEHTHCTNLYKFDMNNGAMTVMRSCQNFVWKWDEPYWLVPSQTRPESLPRRCSDEPYLLFRNGNLLVKQKQQLRSCGEEFKEKLQVDNKNWSLNDVPIEFIEWTMSHLNLSDCIRFRLTCKTWLSIIPPLRTVGHLPMQSGSQSQQLPWLMSFPKNNNSMCTFHHPIYNDPYLLDIPELVDAFVHNSKYGWLLMSTEDSCFFFFNPFTRTTIKLPDLPERSYRHFVGISFSSAPTSSDCVVFGHLMMDETCIMILVHRYGQDEWHSFFIENKVPFLAAYCNPVFCGGFFYCLGNDGKLGVFNTKDGLEEDLVWRVLPTNVIGRITNMSSNQHHFIVECDGQILSVFVGHLGTPVCVCMLDQSKMEWVKVESLGDKVLFLSHTTSILAPKGLKGTENKIFFPMRIHLPIFHGKQCVYYSLRTNMYHSFGRKESSEDWINTCREWQGTWVESFDSNITSTQS